MINKNIVQGKLKELKGEFITLWGRITDSELKKSWGNISSISGIIQQKLGTKHDEVEKKFKKISSSISKKTEDMKDKVKEV